MSEEQKTKVTVEDMNIEDLLDLPQADNKESFFGSFEEHGSFMDDIKQPEQATTEPEKKEEQKVQPEQREEQKSTLEELANEPEQLQKPVSSNNPMIKAIKSMIEENTLKPFDDEKSLDEYTEKDIKELIEANMEAFKEETSDAIPKAWMNSLPNELRYALKYVQDGGDDLKGLFKALSASREVYELNVDDEEDQEQIVRSYYRAKQWGTDEEIEEEIQNLLDKGDLQRKAKQFKPKLDEMSEAYVQRQVLEQQKAEQHRQMAFQNYTKSVKGVLQKENLNGIHLTEKVRNKLWDGLTNANYQTMSGGRTNELYYLVEKYNWGDEPRHDLLAEALWLLSDPDGYKKALGSNIEKQVTVNTVRKLKTEEQSKAVNSQYEQPERDRSKVHRRVTNIFG